MNMYKDGYLTGENVEVREGSLWETNKHIDEDGLILLRKCEHNGQELTEKSIRVSTSCLSSHFASICECIGEKQNDK